MQSLTDVVSVGLQCGADELLIIMIMNTLHSDALEMDVKSHLSSKSESLVNIHGQPFNPFVMLPQFISLIAIKGRK